MANQKGIQGFALNMLKNNPNIRNNPQYQQMIKAIETGDSKTGQALAQNILNNYGVSKEAAVNRGINFFNLGG